MSLLCAALARWPPGSATRMTVAGIVFNNGREKAQVGFLVLSPDTLMAIQYRFRAETPSHHGFRKRQYNARKAIQCAKGNTMRERQ